MITPNRQKEFDEISEIKKSSKSGQRSGERPMDFDSEEDLLDEMDKFREAADLEMAKDRSNLVQEDAKLKKIEERKKKEAEEEKKG